MPHDKIKAAARQRMTQTGEPYAAARRAAVTGHQGGEQPPPAGCALAMSEEIHDWPAGLRDSDPAAARVVVQALAALLNDGARLAGPLVVSTADSWPRALFDALDKSWRDETEHAGVARRHYSDAVSLARDIQEAAARLRSAQAELQDRHERQLAAGELHEAARTARALAAAGWQSAEMKRLLPGVTEAARRLDGASQRLQRGISAGRQRAEILKASYTAAVASLVVDESTAAAGLTGDGGDQTHDESDESAGAPEARLLRDVTARLEQETGQQAWPDGLMELRPAGPDDTGTRILFAVEPPDTALLIAVLDGPEAVEDQRLEAILLSADVLRRVRAGQEPGAAARRYDSTRRLLQEFYPADPGGGSAEQGAPPGIPGVRG
jgi:hypothetical protein